MTLKHTLQGTNSRGNIDKLPYDLTPLEQLQSKLRVACTLEALDGLPTLQARGRQMTAEVKAEIERIVGDVDFAEPPTDEAEQQEREIASYEFLLDSTYMQADPGSFRLDAERRNAHGIRRMVTLDDVTAEHADWKDEINTREDARF